MELFFINIKLNQYADFRIKPAFEPVKKTYERLITLKKIRLKLQKHRNIVFPVFSCGFILIIWEKIDYSLPVKTIVLFGFSVGIYFWGNLKYNWYFKDELNRLNWKWMNYGNTNRLGPPYIWTKWGYAKICPYYLLRQMA